MFKSIGNLDKLGNSAVNFTSEEGIIQKYCIQRKYFAWEEDMFQCEVKILGKNVSGEGFDVKWI